ncbi:Thoeris anti-defense Tad2 family protein [Xenorhabdus stockiae]|uniref:Thoeris anti-defense Tad2 family protein n=1 Tax=Xenorhabdus stockiae TaxID=351614 RepID=UPI003CF88990
MSDVNKLDNKQCPFDPEQYKVKVNDTVAPVGSYPWAMIQVYLGKKLYRSDWNFPVEYIRLAGVPDGDPYIEKHTPNNSIYWQPTQEDMLACDWNLMDCMLSFGLQVGTSISKFGKAGWGYVMANIDGWPYPFGAVNASNNPDIEKILAFFWYEGDEKLYFAPSSKPDMTNYQNLFNLFKDKNLCITIDGSSYNLGKSLPHKFVGAGTYDFTVPYQNADAKKISALMKQYIDSKPLHVCFNWE